MAEVIKMPLMSDTMEEGVIVDWLKEVGDSIEPGDILAEIETDKATMELESYHEGTILHIGAKKGEAVKVDGILLVVGEKGEDFQAALDAEGSASTAAEAPKEEAKKEEKVETASVANVASSNGVAAPTAVAAAPATTTDSRVKASPLAKKMAEENGIALASVAGTGDNGRIVKRDIESYLANPPAIAPAAAAVGAAAIAATAAPVNITLPTITAEEGFEEMAVTQMRKTIAKRLGESKFGAPHFYLTIDINMDNIMTARKSMNEVSPVKISFNDITIKAAAMALRSHPMLNSSWLGDKIRLNKHIHIGMAVAVEDGLLVPVIKFADSKGLTHIAAETKELGGKAKTKKLGLDEMQGNTFTISNLGMMGIEEFTAIINPPDVAIMAVGGIRKVPTLDANGNLKVENKMKVTLSCDHRVVDGATGALFLNTFKSYLENPVNMLV